MNIDIKEPLTPDIRICKTHGASWRVGYDKCIIGLNKNEDCEEFREEENA